MFLKKSGIRIAPIKILNTKIIKSFSTKQQKNIDLRMAYKKFITGFDFEHSECLYENKPDNLYPSIDSTNKWCQWQYQSSKNFQFRIWDGGLNCCLKTSENSFAFEKV